jgi:acetyltransferase-like isoleucine patch superfamily enzyme
MSNISSSARIGQNVVIEHNAVIGPDAVIGDNVYIGYNTIVDRAVIGAGTRIEHNCIIGYSHVTGWVSRPGSAKGVTFDALQIGENCLIREGCTLYVGSVLGNNVMIHHKALVREKTVIGAFSSIGSMCDLEGNLTIGHHCSIHSNCHLCFGTTIGDYVFIAPFTVTTNGNPMGYKRPQLVEKFGGERGPTIGSGCQIAVHVTISPGITMGHECIVAANTVVTKDAEPLSILMGTPGVKKATVEELHRLPLEIRNELGLK